MNEIKGFGLTICLFMVLLSYLKQLIPKGKSEFLMKMIVSTYILLSVIIGFQRIGFNDLHTLRNRSDLQNDSLWKQTEKNLEQELKDSFQRFLDSQKENAIVKEVQVDFGGENVLIRKIIITGPDAETAKSLLAGRFGVGMYYIEVEYE